MTRHDIIDRAAHLVDEVQRYASFDLKTRRFIAYAISLVPELRAIANREEGIAGNEPLPFVVSDAERIERAAAYAHLPRLRACTAKGSKGRRERRQHFGLIQELARVDVKWQRLRDLPEFIFLYERLLGPSWRELLPAAWDAADLGRRRRASPRQLPLIAELREDAAVPSCLENDPAPWFFPSLADAEKAGGAPLLTML